MFTAVYYPHTAVRDENFLKHGLLYWDEIEFVSPFHGYDVLPRYPDSILRELGRFTKPRVPTVEEKKKAHLQIMELLAGDLPLWLQVDRTSDGEDHKLYAQRPIATEAYKSWGVHLRHAVQHGSDKAGGCNSLAGR
jgi:hypothetical protein